MSCLPQWVNVEQGEWTHEIPAQEADIITEIQKREG